MTYSRSAGCESLRVDNAHVLVSPSGGVDDLNFPVEWFYNRLRQFHGEPLEIANLVMPALRNALGDIPLEFSKGPRPKHLELAAGRRSQAT
jgi:hypothetical protein